MDSAWVSINSWKDTENVICMHNVLFSYKEEWNYVAYNKMSGIGDHIKWKK